MSTLITPAEVARLAFSADSQPALDAITEADISAVEGSHIVAVIGSALYEKLLNGYYPELVVDYLQAPIALLVRRLVQPRLDLHYSRLGTMAPKSDHGSPADRAALRALQRSLRDEARMLLQHLTCHLNREQESYPEYDPQRNHLNTTLNYGGFVQTL